MDPVPVDDAGAQAMVEASAYPSSVAAPIRQIQARRVVGHGRNRVDAGGRAQGVEQWGLVTLGSAVSTLDALLLRVARGDQEAFAAWYDATAPMVYGIVLRVLRDRAQAEEVAQEVYVEAWQQAGRFDLRQGSSTAWLNTIAHRRAVDRVRSVERAIRRDDWAAGNEPPDPDPSDLVVSQDECRRARRAIQTLSTTQRQVIELAYFQGRTHREIAELLNIPLGTAKTRIRDGLQKLREYLREAT